MVDSAEQYPQLSLHQVIERALAASPIVASGIGGLRIARAAARVARGAYLPTVALVATATSTDVASGGVGAGARGAAGGGGVGGIDTTPRPILNRGGGNSDITNFATIGLGASIDVFTGGRRKAIKDATREGVRSATWTLDSARYAARFDAESTFYEVIRARELAAVARAGLNEADLLVRFTRDMLSAGTVTKSDLLRAQVQALTMQTQLLAAKDTLLAAAYSLGWLVGANGPIGAKADSASMAIRPLALDDSAIMRVAVESSPMVAGARATLEAAEASLRAAHALEIPTITASAVYTKATIASTPGTASGSGISAVGGSPPAIANRPGWIVSLGTNYPIFNGYQREDSIARARSTVYAARSVANDASRSARARAARLLTTLHTTAKTITLDLEAIRSAREDLRVQGARYRAGISTMLDVLTSELALVQAGYNLAQARNRYHTTRAALEALVGRVL